VPIIHLHVNKQAISKDVPDQTLLVELLRDTLGLTGTHTGCDTTQCGCCVVLVDGVSVKSCTVLAAGIEGSQVTTVEGLSSGTQLHPIQAAFMEHHALQCGFCTPGMMMSALDLIQRHPQPLTPEVVRSEMEGNLCRCTGYHNIVKAIVSASEKMHAANPASTAPKVSA
jgi:carbon-monoxide dehydrogenase small subunit